VVAWYKFSDVEDVHNRRNTMQSVLFVLITGRYHKGREMDRRGREMNGLDAKNG